jgi:hypothetical protein
MALLHLTDQDTVDFREGDAYEETRPEGHPIVRWDFFIEVQTAADRKLAQDGKRSKVYVLRHPYRWRQEAERKVPFVKARGVIDLDHWVELETWPLEEKWDLMGQHEWEVGHGLRAEHDLYHGIP